MVNSSSGYFLGFGGSGLETFMASYSCIFERPPPSLENLSKKIIVECLIGNKQTNKTKLDPPKSVCTDMEFVKKRKKKKKKT